MRSETLAVPVASLLGSLLAVAAPASEPEHLPGLLPREYWYQPGLEHGNPRELWGGHPGSGRKRVTVKRPADGIEILLPGPAIVVKSRHEEDGGNR